MVGVDGMMLSFMLNVLKPQSRSVDLRLNSLQVLSVHIKLLLDAPEHLWRLMERKRYLEAAWLFLLSRVVYRALVSNNDNDEQPWVEDGVDIQVSPSMFAEFATE